MSMCVAKFVAEISTAMMLEQLLCWEGWSQVCGWCVAGQVLQDKWHPLQRMDGLVAPSSVHQPK